MALQTAPDVPLFVVSPNSSSERRITPSWTISQLKTRLEPITGIPAVCQQLSLKIGSQEPVAIQAADEEQTQLAAFPLQAYAELTVSFGTFFAAAKKAACHVPGTPEVVVVSRTATLCSDGRWWETPCSPPCFLLPFALVRSLAEAGSCVQRVWPRAAVWSTRIR